jgi:hypothetical protein
VELGIDVNPGAQRPKELGVLIANVRRRRIPQF